MRQALIDTPHSSTETNYTALLTVSQPIHSMTSFQTASCRQRTRRAHARASCTGLLVSHLFAYTRLSRGHCPSSEYYSLMHDIDHESENVSANQKQVMRLLVKMNEEHREAGSAYEISLRECWWDDKPVTCSSRLSSNAGATRTSIHFTVGARITKKQCKAHRSYSLFLV